MNRVERELYVCEVEAHTLTKIYRLASEVEVIDRTGIPELQMIIARLESTIGVLLDENAKVRNASDSESLAARVAVLETKVQELIRQGCFNV